MSKNIVSYRVGDSQNRQQHKKGVVANIMHAKKQVIDTDLLDTVLQYAPNFHLPSMVINIDTVRANCSRFKELMPSITLFYAVKAMYSKEIIRGIDSIVDGFDVASVREIEDLLSFGVDPSRLSFNNPVKATSSIEKAFQLGVKSFAFQSLSELAKIQLHAPGARVFLRMELNDPRSLVPLSEKFGCEEGEVVKLLRHAVHVGLKPEGITFHVGSQLLDSSAWADAIKKANGIIALARQAGVPVGSINIGGGFPARYYKDDPKIADVAKWVNGSLEQGMDIQYVAEPGRYIVADSAMIISSVIGVEKRHGENWLFIDTGLFQSFMGAVRYSSFPYMPVSLSHRRDDKGMNTDEERYIITGPTCDSQDIVARDVMLPSDMALGDMLAFPNTGAYTVAYGSNFNGFSVPELVHIVDGKVL